MALLRVLIAAALLAGTPARAGEFGPRYLIERVEVRGNRKTASEVIRRQLAVRAGEVVGADDPRVEVSRYRVLALGFFSDVEVRLARGSARGRGVLVVEVVERGTVILNHLFFGSSDAVPTWGGLDVSENNLAGRGLRVGGAFALSTHGTVPLARPQHAFRLRLAIARLLGSPVSLSATALYNSASEPYRTSGGDGDGAPAHFTAVSYRRAGGLLGLSIEAGAYSRLSVDYRLERIEADVPAALVRTLPDGRTTRVDVGLRPGPSWHSTVALAYEYDTRSDPALPTAGTRLAVTGELGTPLVGSSYEFFKLTAQYQGWFRLPWGHVFSAHALLGALVGDAPIFDRYYIGDLNPLIPQRALGLTFSTQPSRNPLGTGIGRERYGALAGRAGVEYLWPLFRGGRYFYGGHLFAGFGGLALGTIEDTRVRDGSAADFPFDLYADAGLRLDTYIGIFNFSLANFLGRLPL